MKIRTRIFLVFALLIAAGIYSLVYWLQGEMRPRYMEAQEDTLVDMSQLLASMLSVHGVQQGPDGSIEIDTTFLQNGFGQLAGRLIDAQIYRIHKQHVDLRIYVTDASGRVIFDSDNKRDLGADYSQWRDVHRTLRGEYGARSTDHDPLYPEGSIMYIAAPVYHQGDIVGVVSVGKPTRNAERFMAHLLNNLTTVSLITVLVTLLIGLALHLWLSRPLARIQAYAESTARGERTRLPALGNNEIGQVGEALESMRQALDGKSYVTDYVQALTHELKSPVAAIHAAAELLDEDMPVTERKRFLQHITAETQRLQELVDRLLELAALEYRPGLENSEPVAIRGLLEAVVHSQQLLADAQSVRLTLQPIDASVNASVNGNRFLLEKALANILKNAIEFSPAGSRVEISSEHGDGWLKISVCDRGVGIPDYARDRVFERFYSLTRPDGRKGSGLGLSFVREIAKLHGAEVTIAANAGGGTCVSISLPTD